MRFNRANYAAGIELAKVVVKAARAISGWVPAGRTSGGPLEKSERIVKSGHLEVSLKWSRSKDKETPNRVYLSICVEVFPFVHKNPYGSRGNAYVIDQDFERGFRKLLPESVLDSPIMIQNDRGYKASFSISKGLDFSEWAKIAEVA